MKKTWRVWKTLFWCDIGEWGCDGDGDGDGGADADAEDVVKKGAMDCNALPVAMFVKHTLWHNLCGSESEKLKSWRLDRKKPKKQLKNFH